MFKKGGDDFLLLPNFLLALLLLLLKVGHEIVDLLFFLIQDFVLLGVIAFFFVSEITINFLDVPLVSINDLTGIG